MAIQEVAVLVETDSSWGRNVLRGIASYAEKFGPWNLLVEHHDWNPSWTFPESWQVDGVIARISNPLLLRQLQESNLPTVDVGDLFIDSHNIDSVHTDIDAWSELAFDHFQSKGFENFAFYAPPSRDYSNRRGEAFSATVARHGKFCSQYRPGYRVGREISREEHCHRVGRWLSQLKLPVAILAVDAKRGKDLAEVCSKEDLNIPDQIAILAGDSDDLSCEICSPPLSSIDVSSRTIGYEAAARLSDRMGGSDWVQKPNLVAPLNVVSRQSTDILAITDETVVRALRFMQLNAYRGITVMDVLEEVPVARRQLERQFKKSLGRLPAEELRRLRLERGKQMLLDTDLSMEAIAEACGYAGSTQFGAAFRKQHGITPLAYRRRTE